MKRSEMVSKIAAVIINHNEPHRWIDREAALEIARVILGVQGEAGMLPPEVFHTWESGHGFGGNSLGNIWESED